MSDVVEDDDDDDGSAKPHEISDRDEKGCSDPCVDIQSIKSLRFSAND